MSWIAYINGNLLELSESKPIAQTKQVNDLARLDNRQSRALNSQQRSTGTAASDCSIFRLV